jgi:membrane-associated protease RseP (regulator of RpoE activity)
MLEAARLLAEGPRPARSILFIAFTGEELGLLGSSFYTKNPTRPLTRTLAMVNLDMVGRLGDEAMIVYGMGTAPEWASLVPSANESVGLPLLFEPDGYGPSDHTSFYSSEIPVLHLFTNVHRDYHRESDDWSRVDGPGVERISRLTANLAEMLANRDTRLTLIPGIGAPSERVGGNHAWLGTVPDFTPLDSGVLLAGVSEDGPAAKADLRKGDIVLRIGERDVADLQGMTDALAGHYPGDRVTITFVRDQRRLTTTAILGDRAERP